MTEGLCERIYACSFVPELWDEVLGDIAKIAGARAGLLFVTNGEFRRGTASTDAGREAITQLVPTGYIERIKRVTTLSAMRYAGFMRDSDMFTEEQMKQDPFYRDILYPRGLGWAAGTNFDLPTGDRVIFSVERDQNKGPVESGAIVELDAIRPHLGRAAMIATRLQLERSRVASETLALLGMPALVMDHRGKALSANALAQDTLQGYVVFKAFDTLAFCDKEADRLLNEAVAMIKCGHSGVQSFPLRGPDLEKTLIAYVVPVFNAACDIFVHGHAVVVIMPLNKTTTPPVDLIQALFDLTPAEARVAQKIATGRSVDDIAVDTGVSRNTVRTHVRGILAKTGCARQAEAAALLGNVGLF